MPSKQKKYKNRFQCSSEVGMNMSVKLAKAIQQKNKEAFDRSYFGSEYNNNWKYKR